MKSQVTRKERRPDWEKLYETAAAQEGLFTTVQAAEAGYSPQLIAKHLGNGRFARVRRSVYRLVHFPPGEHEDLVAVWLWSERACVFSHETALALHGLSDALPSRVHLTLPAAWLPRRLRVPEGVIVHHADVGKKEMSWVGPVPVTSIARTIIDCADAQVAPDVVRDAFEQAADQGLVRRDSVPQVVSYLKGFFSVSHSRSGPRFGSASGSRSGSRTRSSSGAAARTR
jgi:predicted transcriptional regulator of viral defense system